MWPSRGGGAAVVWCTLRDGAAASALADEVTDRVMALGACLPFDGEPDERQAHTLRRARTYRLVQQAHRTPAARELPAPELEAELRSTLAAPDDLDEEVLRRFAAAHGRPEPTATKAERSAALLGLITLIHQKVRAECSDRAALFAPEVTGNAVSFLMLAAPDATMDPLGRWLCARGCQVAIASGPAPRGSGAR